MGWSYSPRIAQCLGWAMLLFCGDGYKAPEAIRRAYQRLALLGPIDPPSHVVLHDEHGGEIGLIFLWYDNVTIICFTNDLTREMLRHLARIGHIFNFQWKEVNHFPPKKLAQASTDMPTFLGLQLAIRYEKRERAEQEHRCIDLIWRHDPMRVEGWGVIETDLHATCTRRAVARALGVLVWHHYLHDRALCLSPNLIDTMKRNVPYRWNDWDSRTPLIEQEIADLRSEICTLRALNPWRIGVTYSGDGIVACTDSSDNAGGRVIFNAEGKIIPEHTKSIRWGDEIKGSHIFIKELLMVVLAAEYIARNFKSVGRMVIGCDNSSVVHAVRRRVSCNRVANQLLSRLEEVRGTILITIVGIRGLDNAADEPSRMMEVTSGKGSISWRAIHEGLEGIHTHEGTRYQGVTPEVRHDDACDVEDQILDQIAWPEYPGDQVFPEPSA